MRIEYTLHGLAAACKVHPQTVVAWKRDGMPTIKIEMLGGRGIRWVNGVDGSAFREWLMTKKYAAKYRELFEADFHDKSKAAGLSSAESADAGEKAENDLRKLLKESANGIDYQSSISRAIIAEKLAYKEMMQADAMDKQVRTKQWQGIMATVLQLKKNADKIRISEENAIPRAQHDKILNGIVMTVRNNLLNLPSKLAPMLEGQDVRERFATIKKELFDCMRAIAATEIEEMK